MNIFRTTCTLRRSATLFSMMALALLSQPLALAETNYFYSDQNIIFYDKNADGVCPAAATAEGGLLTTNDLIKAAIDGAQKFKTSYEKVGVEKDIPWQMLAAIHYRETTYGTTNPSNGQGIFQFYSLYQSGMRFPPGPVTTVEFERQLGLLADLLKETYAKNTDVTDLREKPISALATDARKVKDVFFSYNGRADKYIDQAKRLGYNPLTDPFEGSPYVMNLADDKRTPSLNPDGWGGYVADGRFAYYPTYNSKQAGAYLIYIGLGGSSMSFNGSCGGVTATGNAIVDIARQELAKDIVEIPVGCDAGNTSAVGSCGLEIDKYTDNHLEYWCADFVSWVYMMAGVPFTGGLSGGWRIAGVPGMKDWFVENGEYFDAKDTNNAPMPGDVVFFNGTQHVAIVDTVKGDTITTIEGNTATSFTNNGVGVNDHSYNYRTNSVITGFGRLKNAQ